MVCCRSRTRDPFSSLNMARHTTISVLGCGWLGLPLAEALSAAGFEVKGSVRTAEKKLLLAQKGIRPYQLLLNRENVELDDPSFFDTDMIITAIPPGRSSDLLSVFPDRIRQLSFYLEKKHVPKILFISSTSVYPELSGVVREDNRELPDKASGRTLLQAEKILSGNDAYRTTILRFGGLIGADRDPARFLSRQKGIQEGNKPVNLIHRDDCIAMITELIRQDVWGEVFNACCPVHPTRKEFYEKASSVSGMPAPEFNEDGPPDWKTVDSSKLINRLNYRFIYPDPMDWLEELEKKS